MDCLQVAMIDGLPGVIWRMGRELQATALELEAGGIARIHVMRYPDKPTRGRLN
ncbi:RNA polymerase sigma-70 factor, ECF subfamily [[Luteovulum] sphaeroides subsp. megalophilum]|uniref:RNA polymerase subunit sigma n=1 Tax=Cereibacter sphaeroides TaxID=1063 RepID=UPI000B6418F4|nr:RNA polymerase subunit sigma [Cereibacter sphaeroides]SNT37914.1 RNA polymerase sigma-70 factor, ECF subfamily [[Luteovulum] sphaeroides subsp. megalophilum]